MKTGTVCLHCGAVHGPDEWTLEESFCHCEEPEIRDFTQPDSCVCDPSEWLVKHIPPVCVEFKLDPDNGQCGQCEHGWGCHQHPSDEEAKRHEQTNGPVYDRSEENDHA